MNQIDILGYCFKIFAHVVNTLKSLVGPKQIVQKSLYLWLYVYKDKFSLDTKLYRSVYTGSAFFLYFQLSRQICPALVKLAPVSPNMKFGNGQLLISYSVVSQKNCILDVIAVVLITVRCIMFSFCY